MVTMETKTFTAVSCRHPEGASLYVVLQELNFWCHLPTHISRPSPLKWLLFFFFFWPFKRKLRFRRGGGSTFNESFIDLRVQESWEGIPVHQGVDLQLGIFVHVRAGVQQVPVDHLPNSRIQADLKRNKTRYVRVVCKWLLRETSSVKLDTQNPRYCPFKD